MSAPPTFDELADAALKEMQRQQNDQQAAIERQLAQQNSASTSSPVVPGVPRVASATAGGRTVIRKTAPLASPHHCQVAQHLPLTASSLCHLSSCPAPPPPLPQVALSRMTRLLSRLCPSPPLRRRRTSRSLT